MSRLWPHACNAASRSNFRWGGVAVPTCPAASSAWEVGKLVKMVNYVWILHQRHVRRHVQGGPKISRVTCAVCLATGKRPSYKVSPDCGKPKTRHLHSAHIQEHPVRFQQVPSRQGREDANQLLYRSKFGHFYFLSVLYVFGIKWIAIVNIVVWCASSVGKKCLLVSIAFSVIQFLIHRLESTV